MVKNQGAPLGLLMAAALTSPLVLILIGSWDLIAGRGAPALPGCGRGGGLYAFWLGLFQNLCRAKTAVIREASQQLDNYSKKPVSRIK